MFNADSKNPDSHFESIVRLQQSVQLALGSGNCFTYDSGGRVLQDSLGQRTTFTIDNGIGQRAQVLSGGGTTFGFDNSTLRRVQVPTNLSTTFTNDNSAALPLHVAALPAPWLGDTATESCTPADPRPADSEPEEPIAFDYAAARQERFRLANADFVVAIGDLLANVDAWPRAYHEIMTTHEACQAPWVASCHLAGASCGMANPTVEEVRQEAEFVLLKLLIRIGPRAWLIRHRDEFPRFLFGVIHKVCRQAYRNLRRRESPCEKIGKMTRIDVDVARVALVADEANNPTAVAIALAKMSTLKNVIVIRHFDDGASLKQIAIELAVSYSTIKREYAELKKQLRAELDRNQGRA